jgi:excisionase family DNA binding protein
MTIEGQIRDVVKEVVREELRSALRDSVGALVKPEHDTSDFLTIADAAKLAGVHDATIRTWIRKGELRGHRAGSHHRVRRSELEAFMGGLGPFQPFDVDERAAELARM